MRRADARRRRGGATLVETAFCLVFVLLPLVLGGLQFGLVLTTTHALEQVSREAGRFAAVHYGEGTFDGPDTQGDSANQPASLRNYIKRVAASNGIPYRDISGIATAGQPASGGIQVTPAAAADRNSGGFIKVSITYPMRKRSILGSLGKLGFQKTKVANDADDGRIDHGIEDDSQNLSFLQRDYVVSSSYLME